MEKIIKKIMDGVSGKRIFIFLIFTIILTSAIISRLFGLINMNPDAVMDSLSFYTKDLFYANIDVQGDAGRSGYLILHIIDYLFITQFYPLLAFSLAYLLKKGSINIQYHNYIILIPFIAGLADIMENLCIDISLIIYPQKIMILGYLSPYFSFIKMNVLYLVFLLILLLTGLFMLKKFNKKYPE